MCVCVGSPFDCCHRYDELGGEHRFMVHLCVRHRGQHRNNRHFMDDLLRCDPREGDHGRVFPIRGVHTERKCTLCDGNYCVDCCGTCRTCAFTKLMGQLLMLNFHCECETISTGARHYCDLFDAKTTQRINGLVRRGFELHAVDAGIDRTIVDCCRRAGSVPLVLGGRCRLSRHHQLSGHEVIVADTAEQLHRSGTGTRKAFDFKK